MWHRPQPWLPIIAGGLILLLANTASAQTGAHPWRDNLSRDDVIKALGEPQGDVGNNDAERMIYKGGLLIVLTNNQVTEISGVVPESLKPIAVAAPATTAAATASPAAPAPVAATTRAPAKANSPAATVTAPAPAAAPAAAQSTNDQESEKIINDFSTTSIVPQGTSLSGVITKALGPTNQGGAGTAAGAPKGLEKLMGGTTTADNPSPWSRPDTWQGFLAGWLLKTVLMTLVLKGAFHWKDFPILWREAAFVALGVSLCNQGLAWAFASNDFGKIAGMVQADQIVAGAVLLVLIMKFTAAKQFPTAAAIMISAMTANIALGYAQALLSW